MNIKAALLLFLILFAATITTLVIVFDAPTLEMASVVRITHKIDTDVDPNGDPVDGPYSPT